MKAPVVKALQAICNSRVFRVICGVLLGGSMLAVGGAAAFVASTMSNSAGGHSAVDNLAGQEPSEAEKVKRFGSAGIIIPDGMVAKMGLRTAPATFPTHPISLPSFYGVLALDNDLLSRVRSRFGGEIVAVGTMNGNESQSPPDDTKDRPLRVGDSVKAGQLLAVVWCKDLGEKKSELVDALSQFRVNRDTLTRLKNLTKGIIAQQQIREAERAHEASLVAVTRAETTLRIWRVSDSEIKSVIAEAEQLAREGTKLSPATVQRWARVEIRAPRNGVILEKNIALGDMVDTTADLFKIGDMSHLTVWAHVWEEDLPLLETLPRPIQWTVTLPSHQGTKFSGSLEKVGAVIDTGQHTALVSGRVENPRGKLKVGQSVAVTIELPPSAEQLELPATAVVEDGRQSVVFVQPNSREPRFVQRPVHVVRRLREVVYIQAAANEVQPGDRIVTKGALLLREAIDQLPAPVQQAGIKTSSLTSRR